MKNKKDMKPGGWPEAKAAEGDKTEQAAPLEVPKLEFGDDSIAAVYAVFRDQVYSPKSVLYPSCGFDATPAKIFENVAFVDNERDGKGCISRLREAGFAAFKQDIRLYRPAQRHDLLILMNPYIPTEWATPYLRNGGYVLANNYPLNASWLNAQKDRFSLVGVIDRDQNAGSARITLNKDDELSRTVSIDDIAESRPLEHRAFMDNKHRSAFPMLPFEQRAYMYIFMKK